MNWRARPRPAPHPAPWRGAAAMPHCWLDVAGDQSIGLNARSSHLDTRQFAITATLGVAVLCMAAVGWNLYGPSSRTPQPDKPGPADPAVDLMTPSPLGERVLGNDAAPVTIIEYASMTCSHCARFHEVTYPELKKRYVDTGKVRFIFREFPLDP